MALEAVVFPDDPFLYCTAATYSASSRDLCNYSTAHLQPEHDSQFYANYNFWIDPNSSSPETASSEAAAHLHHLHHRAQPQPQQQHALQPAEVAAEQSGGTTSEAGRRKRRRVKNVKNKEEIENQRMTHIAVERNRRKQMNEYLSVLRSLMPPSYSQRGDQASIIGGAINFVKELEQLLQSMEAEKTSSASASASAANHHPFSDFFSFPQYSTRTADHVASGAAEPLSEHHQWTPAAAAADIEVTMVESHANLKILSKKRPKQLLKLVAGLQASRLSILHLNVTTVDGFILYSVSVKIEEGCQMSTVDEIAAAVNQLFRRIEEEAELSC